MTSASRRQGVDETVDDASRTVKEDEDMNSVGDDRTLGGVRPVDLFNQQLWCWGKDIVRARGNLLVQYGFERIGKPPGTNVSSIYRADVSPTARIVLRGFGVFYGDDRRGGMFLRRYGFAPQLTPAPDFSEPIWTADDLPELTEPSGDDVSRAERLLIDLVEWIRQYEVWIAESIGLSHRRDTLNAWNPKNYTVIPAEEMVSAWHSIARALDVPDENERDAA